MENEKDLSQPTKLRSEILMASRAYLPNGLHLLAALQFIPPIKAAGKSMCH